MEKIKEDDLLEPVGGQAERQVAAVKKEDVIVDLYYQIPSWISSSFLSPQFIAT